MTAWLLKLIPGNFLAEVLGFLVETAFIVGLTWHFVGAHYELKEQAVAAAQIQVNLAQSEKNRTLETQLAQAKQDTQDALTSAQSQIASISTAFNSDTGRVRSALAIALRGTASDSLAACESRSSKAGDLLANGLRVQVELAGAAESLAADARAVHDYAAKQQALTAPK